MNMLSKKNTINKKGVGILLKVSGRNRLAMSVVAKVMITSVLAVSALVAIMLTNYKIVYKVHINGEEAGYITNKELMEKEINKYVLEGDADNVAYVQLNSTIDYDLMLVKRDTASSEKEIFEAMKNDCEVFYRVYAVNVSGEEKFVLFSQDDAQKIVDDINDKQKNFTKKVEVEVKEKVVQEAEFTTDLQVAVNEIITPLQKENDELVAMNLRYASTKTVSQEVLQALKENLQDLDFGKPLDDGIITSRYGWRSSGYHYGLDIAAATGTPIHASESGVVTYSGWSGSYGYIIKMAHCGGYETYYAHCSKLLVDVGDEITKGDTIALVGSTGRSTGPHVHLEVRYNGQTLDPEAFVYDK